MNETDKLKAEVRYWRKAAGYTEEQQLPPRPAKKRKEAVFDAMSDGQVHTLAELAQATGYAEPSVSAQIRELRWPENGFQVETTLVTRRPRVYGYRLLGTTPQPRQRATPKDLLKKCLGYLQTFRKLDPEGETLRGELAAALAPHQYRIVTQVKQTDENGKESHE